MNIKLQNIKLQKFIESLGPGILMAGAAIGVSHLVQSTRAGADFGWQLAGLIVLTNILKYPFFEMGHRYTIARRENLLRGYLRLGKNYLWIFFFLNIITGIGSIGAVTFVSAVLADNFFAISLGPPLWSLILLSFCFVLILRGRYHLLDQAMKFMMAVLVICITLAFIFAWHSNASSQIVESESPFQWEHLPFLIALMGWMPAPLELSVWQSLWIEDRNADKGQLMSLQESRWDFNFGYVLSIVTALLFLGLGALVMHGKASGFPSAAPAFAAQLIDLCAQGLGPIFRVVVSLAALMAMFSTTLTVFEAYPRSLSQSLKVLQIHSSDLIWYLGLALASLVLIFAFRDQMKPLVDLATSIAFVAAPVFAFMNMKLVFRKDFPSEAKAGWAFRALAFLGFTFLTAFAILYAYTLITTR